MKAQISKDKKNSSPAANAALKTSNPTPATQEIVSASAVMAQSNAAQLQIENSSQFIAQRKQIGLLNGMSGSGPAQLVEKDEEEIAQGKFNSNNESTAQLQGKSNNTGLPDQLKSGVESLSGLSMDDVKVHYNSPKPAQLNALAYAQGSDIHVGPGQSQHLPHEAWHVAQQKQGRVQPTTQAKGVAINDDRGLEREADVMGAKAMQMVAKEEEEIK